MTEPTSNPVTTLAQYANGPTQLEAVLNSLTETELNLATTMDSWTIRQIVHHIVDGDDIWKMGIKAALGNQEGLLSFQWYWDKPQTEWAENWKYASRPIEPSLALLRANRGHMVELIQQIPDAWERSIRVKWPQRAEERITVGDVIEMQTRHILGHISDIQTILQAHHQ